MEFPGATPSRLRENHFGTAELRWPARLGQARSVWSIWLIWFVLFIWLILFIWLVSSNKKLDKLDRPDKPNNGLLMLADFFNSLPG
jgi:hypothetical protein